MIALYEQEMGRRPGSPRMYQTSFRPSALSTTVMSAFQRSHTITMS